MKAKHIIVLLMACLFSKGLMAQKTVNYTEEDIKQFYRTIEGAYKADLNDSTQLSLHFVPIWQVEGDRFHWLYMELDNDATKSVMEQKIIEIKPSSNKIFKVYVYNLKNAEKFAGKWGNRNFFDGFTTSILGSKAKYKFLKTKDFEYQTNWTNKKSIKSLKKGDRVHYKFVQGDERFYVKRVPARKTDIIGIEFKALPIDID